MALDLSNLDYRPCVGIMVLNRDGLIWLGRRSDAKAKLGDQGTWWQMPQGGIDSGEDTIAAAHRELYEETRIRSTELIAEHPEWLYYDLPAALVGHKWGGRYRGQKQKWFAMRFVGDDSEIDISPDDQEIEFDAWRWAPASEIMDLVVPFKADVYRSVIRTFGPLIGPSQAAHPDA
ncbi:MAG: RNA pyrophosphohydrolase [Hyphomicrobiaceae bacterium]|nr:RNA pyrophosphohydrolase [Hyphomicrobiaceae bacterium]